MKKAGRSTSSARALVAAMAILFLVILAPSAFGQGCVPGWDETFGIPGATLPAYRVSTYTVFGDDLIAAGLFNQIGSYGMPAVTTEGVARWDGAGWIDISQGFGDGDYELSGDIEELQVYGGTLYGGGNVEKIIPAPPCDPGPCQEPLPERYTLVRYTGSSWVTAGPEATPARVGQLVVHDDGLMYVGGHLSPAQQAFDSAHVVTFNGSGYGRVGDGVHGRIIGAAPSPGIYGMVSISAAEASSSNLEAGVYVVGAFSEAWNEGQAPDPGVPNTDSIARWDPTTQQWYDVGGGLVQPPCQLCFADHLLAIEKYRDASGLLAIYVGGQVSQMGGTMVHNVARWDGLTWSVVQGAGESSDGVEVGPVTAMGVHRRALYVGGDFTMAGGEPAAGVARWNGVHWRGLNGGFPGPASLYAFQSHDDTLADGTSLFVGGYFDAVSDNPPEEITSVNIARWDGCPCPGDVNRDGAVDVTDLNAVLASWGPCPGCPADLNGDGEVNVTDQLIVLSNWGPCP